METGVKGCCDHGTEYFEFKIYRRKESSAPDETSRAATSRHPPRPAHGLLRSLVLYCARFAVGTTGYIYTSQCYQIGRRTVFRGIFLVEM